jgi:hypothetical protein
MAGSLLEREDREKRPPSDLLDLAPHWLNAPCILLFARPKEGLLVPWFLAPGSVRRKKPSSPEPPLRGGGVLSSLSQRSSPDHTEILCKWMSWIVAQTIVRQLVSVVNTSI